MLWIAVVVIILLVAGIVFFSLTTSGRKKTREQFLKEMAEFMEGSWEPVQTTQQLNAFKVIFNFEGENFTYEDLEEVSFREKLLKGYLKCQTSSLLDLYLTEKEKSEKIIQPDLHFPSQKSGQDFKEKVKIRMPKSLKHFHVYTNNPQDTNALLDNDKIAQIFAGFRNRDSRGRSFSSIKILHGEVILEFSSSVVYSPNRSDLVNNVASIENYTKKLLAIIKKLKEIEHRKKDSS